MVTLRTKCVQDDCEEPQSLRSDEGLCKFHRPGSLMVGGIVAFRAQSDHGQTGRQVAEETRRMFRARKGYDPVRADGKDRWI